MFSVNKVPNANASASPQSIGRFPSTISRRCLIKRFIFGLRLNFGGSDVSGSPTSRSRFRLTLVSICSSSSGLESDDLMAGFNLCVSLRDSLRAHSRAI